MILPDANLLLYAYDSMSPFHKASAKWLTRILSGSESVGFCAPVLFAYIRISTSSRAYVEPLPVEMATSRVEEWLIQPSAHFVEMLEPDVMQAAELLRQAGTGGNLTTDAQIAALALRLGATIHSADADFGRFPKVKWLNPLVAK
jgi:toxin-antitoxin system PIN domain toxin